ncbi:class I SAM-dependent methyltransferase [Pedococcus bigeumensis]|jgi:SAM-dependent methyltransferase|uniref:Class I SAM-dependent methyltransferase n=1 Tax=Pedococcus bigeumensis TaxID=433644 RepID=A0A502D658_9MICO|nr:class I SAM-dependent methyltransferase [Pedococcus bigeumensis]TPG19899.1 class I SAM-dependent methyltransferase [Pedococcus bigeumensis]
MTEMEPRTRWSEVSGGPGAATAYQQRFDDLAAKGMDIHGEAAFVASLLAPPARVLDAGCGTGRVATQLTALGYHCVGVDADAAMIEVAEQRDPATTWVRQDLSRLQLRSQAFELAVLAGNVIPLLAPGTLLAAVQRLAAHLQPGGLLVAGFGLDASHLPQGCPVTPLQDYDRACTVAGLTPAHRFGTWGRETWRPESGYAVSVHLLTS